MFLVKSFGRDRDILVLRKSMYYKFVASYSIRAPRAIGKYTDMYSPCITITTFLFQLGGFANSLRFFFFFFEHLFLDDFLFDTN